MGFAEDFGPRSLVKNQSKLSQYEQQLLFKNHISGTFVFEMIQVPSPLCTEVPPPRRYCWPVATNKTGAG